MLKLYNFFSSRLVIWTCKCIIACTIQLGTMRIVMRINLKQTDRLHLLNLNNLGLGHRRMLTSDIYPSAYCQGFHDISLQTAIRSSVVVGVYEGAGYDYEAAAVEDGERLRQCRPDSGRGRTATRRRGSAPRHRPHSGPIRSSTRHLEKIKLYIQKLFHYHQHPYTIVYIP